MDHNIAVLCLDTVRKDVFNECATRIRTRSDFSIEGCHAASSWTIPSHASMFTGDLPHVHGSHTYNRTYENIPRSSTFLGELDEHQTIGVSANHYASSAVGFDTLFDHFVDVDPRHIYQQPKTGITGHFTETANRVAKKLYYITDDRPIPKLRDDGAKSLIKSANNIVSEADQPFFLFMNFVDAHQPHARNIHHRDVDVPYGWSSNVDFVDKKWELNTNEDHNLDEFLKYYRELYRASIEYLDRILDSFIDHLTDLTNRPTTIIVTSDHGEHLAYSHENRLFEHTSSLSEALLHIPLEIINAPDGFLVSSDQISLLDLGKLIISLVCKEEWKPNTTHRAEIIGASPGISDNLPGKEYQWWDRAQRCRIERDRKTVWDSIGNCDIYDLDEPPSRETTRGPCDNELTEDKGFAVDISTYKDRFSRDLREDSDNQVMERLKDLGYA